MCVDNDLRHYFPMIREREEILADIKGKPQLCNVFESWRTEQQEEFLNFCTGVRGMKLLYDSFFKEVMNPEYDPVRMNDFLSELLKQRVEILKVLPNDSVRIAAESTLLITDLVVQLEDGSIANIEIQKIGYMFPGERASCYSADLLLRQYKRVRDECKKQFNYRDIKPVYTIVLFEQSPKEFHYFPDTYLHYIEPRSNTGIKLNLLQKYLFIPLDIFKKSHQNKSIFSKIDAWLTFLCSDEPEDIIRLITTYPDFKLMYDDVYNLCNNIEKVMEMFSKELKILDENTVQYMIDEMQGTIDGMQGTIDGMQGTIDGMQGTIDEMQSTITSQQSIIADKDTAIEALQKRIVELEKNNEINR